MAAPVIAGSVCTGFTCTLWIAAAYSPYFLLFAIFIFFLLLKTKLRLSRKIITSIVLSLLVILVYHYFLAFSIESGKAKNAIKTDLVGIIFPIYLPESVPAGYKTEELKTFRNSLYVKYQGKNGLSFVLQENQRPASASLNPPKCQVSNFVLFDEYLGMDTSYLDGECRLVTTKKGNQMYLMDNKAYLNSSVSSKYALIFFEKTMVIVRYGSNLQQISEQDLGDFSDSLQQTPVNKIEPIVSKKTLGF
ncbi:MAG: hypothetical protein ACM3KM_02430 [Acidobacteriaceae bacterium]